MSTAQTPQRTFLAAGLGKYQPADPTAAALYGGVQGAKALADADVARAKEIGFDVTVLHVNPLDPTWSAEQFRKLLMNQKFEGISIGFGIRGNREYTALFEELVNTARELNPSSKLGFSVGPDDIYGTIIRLWPELRQSAQ